METHKNHFNPGFKLILRFFAFRWKARKAEKLVLNENHPFYYPVLRSYWAVLECAFSEFNRVFRTCLTQKGLKNIVENSSRSLGCGFHHKTTIHELLSGRSFPFFFFASHISFTKTTSIKTRSSMVLNPNMAIFESKEIPVLAR